MSYVEPPTEPDYVSMGSGRRRKSIPEIRGDLQRLAEENAGRDEHFRRFCEDFDAQLRDATAVAEEREGQVTVPLDRSDAERKLRRLDGITRPGAVTAEMAELLRTALDSTTHNTEEGDDA